MNRLIHITCLVIILFIEGCYVTNDIKTKDEFINKSKSNEISLITRDTTKYFLSDATLLDSIIRGTGKMDKNGISKDFKGDIKLSDVVCIQAQDFSFWGTVAAIGVVGYLGLSTKAIIEDDKDGTKLKVVYPYRGGQSCPLIYSKINSEYKLEGEAIPGSVCKTLETVTTNSLTQIISGKKEIELRITNERPETHYINSVKLFKYDCLQGNKLLADEYNKIWPVRNPQTPLYAEDLNKHNIKSIIEEADKNYWESDLSTATAYGNFRDRMIITFGKEKFHNSASLIVKAINTQISQVLFRKVYDFLGDELLDFVYAAENDPMVLSSLKSWIEEVALKVFVWNGNSWEYKGKIYAEATMLPFERLIRMDLKDINTDELKIKLEFMTDVWKIDAEQIDYSNVVSPEPVEIPLISANTSGSEVKERILTGDEQYQVLLPGDKLDLKYYDHNSTSNSRYFLNVSGYLYEWYVKQSGSGTDFLANIPQGVSRLELFKVILNNKNLLLPPVYIEWEKIRNTF
ncbi:MAG TPA: hypothetical protein VLB50_07140 [Ignavibacteriaceae bacterium]|nr:hypothetical protein [Ignavibacteriaceae bacterium]